MGFDTQNGAYHQALYAGCSGVLLGWFVSEIWLVSALILRWFLMGFGAQEVKSWRYIRAHELLKCFHAKYILSPSPQPCKLKHEWGCFAFVSFLLLASLICMAAWLGVQASPCSPLNLKLKKGNIMGMFKACARLKVSVSEWVWFR